jgi:hypothetical protein
MSRIVLTQDQINSLIKYDANMERRLSVNAAPAFTKDQTIQILNAVTELRTITDDGCWSITYKENGKSFYVKPGPEHSGKSKLVPCGSYITEWAMDRLEL